LRSASPSDPAARGGCASGGRRKPESEGGSGRAGSGAGRFGLRLRRFLGAARAFRDLFLDTLRGVTARERQRILRNPRDQRRLRDAVFVGQLETLARLFRGHIHARLHEHEATLLGGFAHALEQGAPPLELLR
jgi:hypothetical protein